MTNVAAIDTTDSLRFDGSCNPNPGGRMGCGWIITIQGEQQTGECEQPPAQENTNNTAEFTALLLGLQEYIRLGGKGPLNVFGDSQLTINIVTGTWAAKAVNIRQLLSQIKAELAHIPGKVTFSWQYREFNAQADKLAAGKSATSQTLKEKPIMAMNIPDGINPLTAQAILVINETADPGFRMFARLRVGGADGYSGLKLAQLETIAGPECSAYIAEALKLEEGSAVKLKETALRWTLRGLSAQNAIKKIRVDQELARMSQKDKPKPTE